MGTPPAQDQLRQPLYFASGGHTLFGWLLRPAGEAGEGIGLLICKPFGFEAICSHSSLRAFAAAAASAGVPSLCFDYAGTGDSEDLESQADQLEVWTRDVIAAAAELQRRTGVERVCLLGFRLGALLATRAASQAEAVKALIAVAPVVSGARYLRELQMTVLAQTAQRGSVGPSTGVIGSSDAGSLEVNGYELSAATVAALAQIDLMKLRRGPVSELLLIDRSDVPTARPWADAMSRMGVRSEYRVLPGFAEMMMTTAYYTVTPERMVAAMHDWLVRLPGALPADRSAGSAGSTSSTSGAGGAGGAGEAARPDTSATAPSMALTLCAEAGMPGAELVERAIVFGSEPALFGVITEPPEPRSRDAQPRVVILLNDGANPHIGSNRLYVALARTWARRGYVVLRMDLAGLGDSATRAGRPPNEVFPAAAIDDLRAAIQLMRSRYAARDVTLGGLCSGAYHALRAAVAALPVTRLVLVNQRDFFWRADMNGNYLQLEQAITGPSIYRDRARSAASWKKLLRGQANVGRIAEIYGRRLWLAVESAVHEVTRSLHIHLPRDLGCELEQLAARDVRVVFVYSRGDAGRDLLRILAGSSIKRLGERCRVHVIDGSDHTFTSRAARAVLQKVLNEELFAREALAGPPLLDTGMQAHSVSSSV